MQGNVRGSASRQQMRGTSLIEILITLFIVAIGVLGIVSLQYNSLKAGSNASYRYQASLLAYDMVERMRSNPLGVAAGHYNAVTIASTYTVPATVPTPVADMYKLDLSEWKTSLSNALPSGNGSITVVPGQSNTFTIRVEWAQLEGLGTGGATESVDVTVKL